MRANKLSILFLAGFVILFLNLLRMQVIQGNYYRSLSERNRIRVIYLEGPRGKIVDRNGIPVVNNRLSFNVSAVPHEAKFTIHESCGILSMLLHVEAEELESRFEKGKPGHFNSILLAEDISPTQAMSIEERLDGLPGFMIETRPQREYPLRESVAHVTGFIGPMTTDELDRFEGVGYRQADWVGRDGVERMYESYLRGVSGGLQIEVDSRGRLVRALGVKEPVEGKDIELTLDSRLQSQVQNLLRTQKGAVIVMELEEGGLLSMNSNPSFDPNLFSSGQGRRDVGKYIHDADAPMVNRGIRGQYPPGSIFKIVTALSGLEHKKITPVTSVNCRGYFIVGGKRFGCWNEAGHGPQNLSQAFAHSCNVYFYTTGLLAGIETLLGKTLEFGFSKPTGVDLPGEKNGFVPSREWKRKTFHEGWYDGETVNLAIGQGYLQVTPIQALNMVAAVATHGHIFKPHLVNKIEGMRVAERHTRFLNVPEADWKAVEEGLDQVVNSDTGTGRLARVPGVHILGKTGTAQSGQHKTHAWFVGFAPAKNPKIALVVFLENGGRGGVAAAGVAKSVFQWLKEASYL